MWVRQGDRLVNLSQVSTVNITDSLFIFRFDQADSSLAVSFDRSVRITWCEEFDVPPVLNNLSLVP